MGAPGGGLPVPATHHVANQPIAHHVLDALEAAGVHEVVVACSEGSASAMRDCLASRERRSATQLEFVHRPGPMEFASALSLAAPLVDEAPCIVHAAGGLLAEPLAPLANCLDGNGPDAVLMVHHAPAPDQRLSAAAQNLLHLAELDPARSTLGVAGVWAFGPGGIRSVAAGDTASTDAAGQRHGPHRGGPAHHLGRRHHPRPPRRRLARLSRRGRRPARAQPHHPRSDHHRRASGGPRGQPHRGLRPGP